MVQMALCSGCNCPILDQFIHSVLDKSWHRECIKCADCHILLTERCYSREGQLYCRFDFLRRYGPKCQVCLEQLQSSELVRQSRGNVYHLKCFTCSVCRRQLSTGEHYYLLDVNRFICKEDYTSSMSSLQLAAPPCGGLTGPPQTNGTLVTEKDLDPVTSELTLNQTSVALLSQHQTDFSPKLRGVVSGAIPGQPNSPPKAGRLPNTTTPHDLLTGVLHRAASAMEGVTSHNTSSSADADMDDMLLNPSSDDGEIMNGFIKEEDEANNNNNNNTDLDDSKLLDNDNASLDDDLKSSYSASTPDGKGMGGGDGGSEIGLGDQGSSGGGPGGQGQGSGTKRRGPRTTIKAKQLDTLKAAFAATPKPTRHVREQLAQETGLSMRVIQVWFQNRRSKERRMKQLSAMGARRPFFRNPRRMRTLRGGLGPDDMGPDGAELMGNPAYHSYFSGGHPEFYNAVAAAGGFVPGGPYPGEFFHPVHGQPGPPPAHFMGNPPPVSMATGLPDTPGMHDERFLLQSGLQLDPGFYPGPEFPGVPCSQPGPPTSPGGEHHLVPQVGSQGGRHLDSPFQLPPCSMGGTFLPVQTEQHAIANMEAW